MLEHRYIWKRVSDDEVLFLGSYQPIKNPFWTESEFDARIFEEEEEAKNWLKVMTTSEEYKAYRDVELYTVTLTLSPMSVAEAKRRISPSTKG